MEVEDSPNYSIGVHVENVYYHISFDLSRLTIKSNLIVELKKNKLLIHLFFDIKNVT